MKLVLPIKIVKSLVRVYASPLYTYPGYMVNRIRYFVLNSECSFLSIFFGEICVLVLLWKAKKYFNLVFFKSEILIS